MSQIKTQLAIYGENHTKKAFSEVNNSLGSLSQNAKKAGAAVLGALSVGVFASWIKDSIDAADAARKSAQATGLAVEKYTALEYAAKLAGVETGNLDSALGKFNKTVDAAANGSEKQVQAFARLGISVRDQEGALKSNDQLLAEVADRFQSMPDGVQKSAIAMELFGRSGAQLIPLLNGGSKGLAEMTAEAEALGLVITEDQAAAAEVLNDNISRLGAASTGAANKISGELLPTLVSLSDLVVDLNKNTEASSVIADVVGGALKVLATILVAVGVGFQAVGNHIAGTAAAAAAAVKGDFAGAIETLNQVTQDNNKLLSDAGERISNLWSDAGKETAAAAIEQEKQQAKMLDDVTHTTEGMKDQLKQQVKDVQDALRQQLSAQRDAARDLEKAKQEQLDTEKRYSEALAKLNGGTGPASFGQAQALKVGAREALRAGDVEGAKQQAQAALDILQQLASAGENTFGFQGFIKELQDIETSANQINVDRAKDSFDEADKKAKKLKDTLDQLKKVKISIELPQEEIAKIKGLMQQVATELGKELVITPTLAAPDYTKEYTLQDPGPAPQDYVLRTPKGYATGGLVTGAGTGTSDSIPALLSNGEYVIRAAAVSRLGQGFLDLINQGLPIARFADGGLVEAATVAAPVASPGRDLGRVELAVGGERYSLLAEGEEFSRVLRRTATKFGRTKR